MTKFTPEEISLCKQIAKKYRKEIEYGDWFIMPSDPHLVPTILQESPAHKLWQSEINKKAIPLWTISDCLEFFKKKKCIRITIEIRRESTEIYGYYTDETGRLPRRVGKTPLEACLKAVLAVLEEGK